MEVGVGNGVAVGVGVGDGVGVGVGEAVTVVLPVSGNGDSTVETGEDSVFLSAGKPPHPEIRIHTASRIAIFSILMSIQVSTVVECTFSDYSSNFT